MGRFLSPDPYVQAPDFSQSYNRYSYCWNNPLRYTDPNGEWLLPALIGGAVNLGFKAITGQIHSFGDGLKAFGTGALAGLTGFGASSLISGTGFIAGATSGVLSSFSTGTGLALANGENIGDALSIGAKTGLFGFGTGFAGGAINGYVQAKQSNINPLTGKSNVKDIITEDVMSRFEKHAFSNSRHDDLGLTNEQIKTNARSLMNSNQLNLREGDNTFVGKINGIEKSFKVYMKDGAIKSMNMYPGVSTRVTRGPIINYGEIKW